MILTALTLAALAAPSTGTESYAEGDYGTVPDTVSIREVGEILNRHYGARQALGRGMINAFDPATASINECLADRGEICFGGDPAYFACAPNVRCGNTAAPSELLDPLVDMAVRSPGSSFAMGQAIYALVSYDRTAEAVELAARCEADAWWCGLLSGHALQAAQRVREAEDALREVMRLAPEEVQCELQDSSRLLGSWLQQEPSAGPAEWRELQQLPCDERLERLAHVWWLSDPLYALAGNDRWAEHASRHVQWMLDLDLRRFGFAHAVSDLWGTSDRVGWWRNFIVRRGPRDSYRFPPRRERASHGAPQSPYFTSAAAARYHFVPDFGGGDLSRPSWRLYAELDDEGYTPPYGTFHQLPVQIARFRSPDTPGDSMRVAAAATVVGTELVAARNPEPHLILTNAPESFPVRVTGDFDEYRTSTFLVTSAAERHVLSYEVLSDGRFGWRRQMLEPLEGTGAGISDVLLYRPDDPAPPEALEPAAALMLGESAVAQGAELGVFWEAYGAPAGTEVTVELEIEGGGGGFFSRLRNLLPGGGAARVRLSWSEPSPGEVFPRGVSLGTEGLKPGSYTLVVRIAWEGQDVLESTRSLEVR